MRALTLQQPWAWAIAHAGKRLENRRWAYLRKGFVASLPRTRIAIHAGHKRPAAWDCDHLEAAGVELPAAAMRGGRIVATCQIVGVVRAVDAGAPSRDADAPYPYYEPLSGDLEQLDRLPDFDREGQMARWWRGPFALVLGDVIALADPPHCDGHLGLWTLDKVREALVLDEERHARARLCGKYLGDNDATTPQLTCVRRAGHDGRCDKVRGDP